MKWKFWKHTDLGDSPGVLDARGKLEEAKKQYEDMEKLMVRHRKVRKQNHLGPAAAHTMRGRKP